MLVLTRKPGQAVVIGDDVRIVILAVEGDRVRIAIEAPPEVKVLRGEVHAGLRAAAGTSDKPPAS